MDLLPRDGDLERSGSGPRTSVPSGRAGGPARSSTRWLASELAESLGAPDAPSPRAAHVEASSGASRPRRSHFISERAGRLGPGVEGRAAQDDFRKVGAVVDVGEGQEAAAQVDDRADRRGCQVAPRQGKRRLRVVDVGGGRGLLSNPVSPSRSGRKTSRYSWRTSRGPRPGRHGTSMSLQVLLADFASRLAHLLPGTAR